MKPKAVIRFSKYLPDPNGHGGEKRTAQLFELFEKANVHVIDFEKTSFPKRLLKKIKYFIIGLKIIIKRERFFGLFSAFKEAKQIGYDLYSLEHILNNHKERYKINYFIWEHTWSPYWYMPLIASRVGLKIITIPHNLESLVYSQRSHKPKKVLSPLWLDEEIAYLDYANTIFCISREEQWLLSLKVNPNKVHYLPYYPPKATVDSLLHIRKERLKKQQHHTITILGSAINPPTLKGMLDLKKHLLAKNDPEITYDFVGYGVKWLLTEGEIVPENILISDSVAKEVLEAKLINTSCVLIHQIPSSGALTKIQEMLIAGIPVIVNHLGARSFYNIKGVYVYESLIDLDSYLKDLDRLDVPDIPIENPKFENKFLSLL